MVFLRKHKWKSCLSMLILGAANLFLINVVFIADDPERTGTNRFCDWKKILEHSYFTWCKNDPHADRGGHF